MGRVRLSSIVSCGPWGSEKHKEAPGGAYSEGRSYRVWLETGYWWRRERSRGFCWRWLCTWCRVFGDRDEPSLLSTRFAPQTLTLQKRTHWPDLPRAALQRSYGLSLNWLVLGQKKNCSDLGMVFRDPKGRKDLLALVEHFPSSTGFLSPELFQKYYQVLGYLRLLT